MHRVVNLNKFRLFLFRYRGNKYFINNHNQAQGQRNVEIGLFLFGVLLCIYD